MRTQLPGFDPFYRGWEAYEQGGHEAVEELEAPLLLADFTEIDPELASYAATATDLLPNDFRFGAWPDAMPVPVREEGGPVGVHLNTFGTRQVRHGVASEAERATLNELTHQIAELVRDAIEPAEGAATFMFGRVPTMHLHIVGRERRDDGLHNWQERKLADLSVRRAMRERLAPALTEDRRALIIAAMTRQLTRAI